MKLACLMTSLMLVLLFQARLSGDITNGNPFLPNAPEVTYIELVDYNFYNSNYGSNFPNPIGRYNWNEPGAYAHSPGGGDPFNYDRTVVDITIDFGGIADFNHVGANLNAVFGWASSDLDNAQDRIYVHAYDIMDTSTIPDLESYLFNSPDNFSSFSEGGIVNSIVGFKTKQLDDGGDRVVSIDIDLTDIFDVGTRTARVQVEYIDPDLGNNLSSAAISQYTATWTPVPEPGCLVVLGFCAGAGLLAYRTKERRPRRKAVRRGAGEITKKTGGLTVFLALVALLQTPVHADITNGNPFGPFEHVTYGRKIDRTYYNDNYGDPTQIPPFERGNYEWDQGGALAWAPDYSQLRTFNWDRTVVEITVDFGGVADFNHVGANLNLSMGWQANDLTDAQDTIYVHSYDVLDPSLGVNLDNYLFNDPAAFFDYHDPNNPGAVTFATGFQTKQFQNQGEGKVVSVKLRTFDFGSFPGCQSWFLVSGGQRALPRSSRQPPVAPLRIDCQWILLNNSHGNFWLRCF